jgi:murein DD-endopeptidase MepM/ murein hydrolase activator NlpD
MRIVIRLVAVLTVLLSLALMAVSAYAAKTEPAPTPATSSAARPDNGATPASAQLGGSDASPTAQSGSAATASQAKASSTPFRFAAPNDAASLGVSSTGRGNLSTSVRVWSVSSSKSGLFGRSASTVSDIPPDQLQAMQQIGRALGIPWPVLAGIAKVESDFGRNMSISSAGAIGYGQFLPEEWGLYGAGGDPYDYHDALLAMARYLLVAGAPADTPDAIYSYNHSWPYVEAVLSYAASYGYTSGAAGTSFIWPVLGPISSYFGPDHPLGIDIDQTNSPNAPVWAAHDGDVVFAGGDPCCSYGRYVILQGVSGLATLYAHLDSIAVTQGQAVSRGTVLGRVGCTGHCTGPHLHFEVIDHGVRRNPLDYLPGGN